jgi:hypothetical protein
MGVSCTSTPFRASIGVSPDFALPRPRSPGFGYHDCGSGPFQTPPLTSVMLVAGSWFPYAFGDNPLKLATIMNSLARVSRRKV